MSSCGLKLNGNDFCKVALVWINKAMKKLLFANKDVMQESLLWSHIWFGQFAKPHAQNVGAEGNSSCVMFGRLPLHQRVVNSSWRAMRQSYDRLQLSSFFWWSAAFVTGTYGSAWSANCEALLKCYVIIFGLISLSFYLLTCYFKILYVRPCYFKILDYITISN